MNFTPTEACAYALALLETSEASRHPSEFLFMEACGFMEEAGVSVSVERPYPDSAEFQAEVCSPVECEDRQAFAMVGTGTTRREALTLALRSIFQRD